jgi:hypothetical protein
VIGEIKSWKAAYLRGDKDVLPRNPALVDGVSNFLLILRSDVSIGIYLAEASGYIRRNAKRRQCDGSRQLELP